MHKTLEYREKIVLFKQLTTEMGHNLEKNDGNPKKKKELSPFSELRSQIHFALCHSAIQTEGPKLVGYSRYTPQINILFIYFYWFTRLPLRIFSVSLLPSSAWVFQGERGSGLWVREADGDRSCAKLVMDLIRA